MTQPRPPYPERRGSSAPDTGERRRAEDLVSETMEALERIQHWMDEHDDWAREWTTRMDQRVTTVESRADLLDGRAGNDGGIIGVLGELKGAVEKMEARQERQANVIAEMRGDVLDVKAKTGAEDGQKRTTAAERYAAIVIPVLVAVLPVVGTVIAAYFALKGQLAQAPGR